MSVPAEIIVVGSLHYDIMVDAPHRPAKGETVTGQRWFPKFGGKGGNQAVAAANAGANTLMVGAIGDDVFSEFILQNLQTQGLDTKCIERINNAGTGMSVAITDSEGDYGAVIVSGANLCIDTEQFKNDDFWGNVKILILQNEVPDEVNIQAAKAAHQHGAKTCLNAAPAREMPEELLQLIDILIVNGIEAEALSDLKVNNLDDALAASQHIAKRFPVVLTTAGEHGVALATNAGTQIKLDALPVELISTHGAGDVFVGTFCASLIENYDFEVAMKSANKNAAEHISTNCQYHN